MKFHLSRIPYKSGTWGWRVQRGNLWTFYWTFCEAINAQAVS